jgi:hypothetical protein
MSDMNAILNMGFRKIVYSEKDDTKPRTLRGSVTREGDFFIIDTGHGEVWIHKDAVIAIKDGGDR